MSISAPDEDITPWSTSPSYKGESSGLQNIRMIYLDNAATTFPKPESVYQAADKLYRSCGGNAGRGQNPLARQMAQLVAETRQKLAKWLNAPSPERVIFTPSVTIALNQAILGEPLSAGDAVYVTPFEHNSILRPLEHLRRTRGIVIREIPVHPRTLKFDLTQLRAQFQSIPPVMVAMTQVSNVCGVMPPIEEIAELARKSNPSVCTIVDGAQAAGLYPLDLTNSLIDCYAFSGHKALYGPYGVAGLILCSEHRPEPILFGGTGTSSESVETPDELPSAYEPGSHNVWAIAGLNAALDWLRQIGHNTIVAHVHALAEELRKELMGLTGVRVYTPIQGEPWAGILAFAMEGVQPQAVEVALGTQGIAVRAGLHCAPWTHRFLETLKAGGLVRCSPGYFNVIEDVTCLIKCLKAMM